MGKILAQLLSQFKMAIKKVTSVLNPQKIKIRELIKNIIKKVSEVINNFIVILTKKPSQKEDYIKIGKFYFSKRFLILSIIFIIAVGTFIVKVAYPWADGRLWTATVKVGSSKYNDFTGKAKVKDKAGRVIYIGEMSEGKIQGQGKQYDAKGNITYIGQFEDSEYSGQGELYNDTVLIYKGAFLKNLYDGDGKLYDSNKRLTYSGQFSCGQKSGKGVDYNVATGLREYYGDFQNGLREGNGVLYGSDGSTVIYEGAFVAGEYSGEGKYYENGILKYEGQFVNGLYEGDGTLYDTSTKKMLYKGQFAGGLYEGDGTLYDPNTSKVVYTGAFESGLRAGEGESYDILGGVTFSGTFKDDNIDYISYIGSNLDEVTEQFGKESYRINSADKLILIYLGLDTSVIFSEDSDSGEYTCEKFVMGTRQTFMGLNSRSSRDDITNTMGKVYSAVSYTFKPYYDKVFKALSIDLSSSNSTPSEKFVMDNYFIRFYYNGNKTEIRAIEVCTI